MVGTDGKTTSDEMTSHDDWSAEIERLSSLVEQLVDECARLRAQNDRLQQQIATVASQPSTVDEAVELRRQLRSERRRWASQRQALADRIEAILGKFQWMEEDRRARTPAVGEG